MTADDSHPAFDLTPEPVASLFLCRRSKPLHQLPLSWACVVNVNLTMKNLSLPVFISLGIHLSSSNPGQCWFSGSLLPFRLAGSLGAGALQQVPGDSWRWWRPAAGSVGQCVQRTVGAQPAAHLPSFWHEAQPSPLALASGG